METIKVMTGHGLYELEGDTYRISEHGVEIKQVSKTPGGETEVVAVFKDWLILHTEHAKLKRLA